MSKYENDLLMIPKILLAFDMQFWMCALKDNFPSNITSKPFSSEQIFNTDSSSPDLKMYLYLGLLYPMCKTWHLFTLKCRPHLKDHSWSLAKSSCKIIEFLVMLKILVSSANIWQKLFMLSAMSFMKIVNNTGPRILLCGIPLNTSALDENFFPFRTLWVLSYRKLFTQLCTPPLYHTS